jgi:hypothetical protein
LDHIGGLQSYEDSKMKIWKSVACTTFPNPFEQADRGFQELEVFKQLLRLNQYVTHVHDVIGALWLGMIIPLIVEQHPLDSIIGTCEYCKQLSTHITRLQIHWQGQLDILLSSNDKDMEHQLETFFGCSNVVERMTFELCELDLFMNSINLNKDSTHYHDINGAIVGMNLPYLYHQWPVHRFKSRKLNWVL